MGLVELVSRLSIFKTGLDLLLPLPPAPVYTTVDSVRPVYTTVHAPTVHSIPPPARACTYCRKGLGHQAPQCRRRINDRVICKLSPRRSVDVVVAKLLLRMAASVGVVLS